MIPQIDSATGNVEGARIYLRPLTAADADGPYRRWMSDPGIVRLTLGRASRPSADDLRCYIAEMIRDGRHVFKAIIHKDSGRHIGNIKLGPLTLGDRNAMLGLLIGEKDFWRQGFATEAIELMCAYAFTAIGLDKVSAAIYEENQASLGAFRKAGFAVEEIRKGRNLVEGRLQDEIIVSCPKSYATPGVRASF